MKGNPSKLKESLHRLKSHLREADLAQRYSNKEPLLSSELFSTEQMEQHGKNLAGFHKTDYTVSHSQQLLSRLEDNESVLIEVHELVSEAVKEKRQITPAAEWLLDNFYIIEEQIRTGRRHLPKGYSKELPRLQNGPTAGLPRVYDIAKEVISHGEGHIDYERLRRFVTAYQDVAPLKLGELWAIPIMLRLALIENLRRVAVRIAAGRIDRNLANSWADRLIEVAEKDPKNLILVMADMARSNPPLSTPFISEFVRRLQGQSPSLAFPLTWMEQRLSETNQSTLQMIQYGNQQQAADQVSISNSIASLRLLSALDWRDFIESVSHVEHILSQDPSGRYALMDFSTRDNYRHVIENIAKRSRCSEIEAAKIALALAAEAAKLSGQDDRSAHIGYYLIGKGLSKLEQQTAYKPSYISLGLRTVTRFPLVFYTGLIVSLTLIPAWLLFQLFPDHLNMKGILGLLMVLILSLSYMAISIVNWITTLLVKPRPLPRLDFSRGIPHEWRSLVVVPSMLLNKQNIEDLAEALEVRFLANQDKNLHFGLLTDFKDAREESTPEDEELIQLASRKIMELNEKYPGENKDTFFLFHRPRLWNATDKIWMGYERKRGKLSDLNSLLRGGPDNKFSVIIGKKEVLQTIKFVITLDSDTQLPRDSARQFIGTLAHPLNRPKYDPKKQRVTQGYTILQPRVAVSLPGSNRSRYAKLFGTEPGIDPYTRTISDVYQDLFGEGSFIGKGIYDVDAFEKTLKDRFPENRILSHDLLEGCYARSGLLSDVLLFEEYPSSYRTDVTRRARWIRGDWQLVSWLLPFLPKVNGTSGKNPLSLLSIWKIFDNLRRSLVPAALLLLLFAGWAILTPAWLWTLVVIGIIIVPPVIISILRVFQIPEDVKFPLHVKTTGKLIAGQLSQAAFFLISLPYEAYYSVDALLRTLYRLLISKKRLLEWNPYSGDSAPKKSTPFESFRTMWVSPFIGLVSAAYLLTYAPATFALVWPIIVLWMVFPIVAWWISTPVDKETVKLTEAQYLFLRKTARKTWSFFETFVGPDDNWLPPDNYQEQPIPVLAHRTSPTNIGLSLLANLAACDFGYIHTGEFLKRTANTFKTMKVLERYQGHFYNWYDTISLKPLRPLYISSVDSGNLAGHLLTLKQGFFALPDEPLLGARPFEAIKDTLNVLLDYSGGKVTAQVNEFQKYLANILNNPPLTVASLFECFEKLDGLSANIINTNDIDRNNQYQVWSERLYYQCRDALNELKLLIPEGYRTPLPENDAYYSVFNGIPTLSEISEISDEAKSRIAIMEELAKQVDDFASMEYAFLYDKSRHLLTIGYNVEDRRRDAGYYDLLASEARLACFVAIAQNQVPQESWFSLGRLLTSIEGEPVLLSWSGSMFEYLMPLIVMPGYENSLLDQTCKAAVERQIEYGKHKGVPWGISESGYNTVDVLRNYQYRAFGVPGLGLKRGLDEDLVIAPYASALALLVMPEKACENLERMADKGFMGNHGFYEAVDYTVSRVPRGQSMAIVKSFMAHHTGMEFLSFAYILLNRPMQKRFESEPLFQSALLLLQERILNTSSIFTHTSGVPVTKSTDENQQMPYRLFNTPDTQFPEVNLLSNGGGYQVMITNAGGGYSRWKELDVTRWREDTTRDNWGTFCYLRDAETGNYWSTTFQPTLHRPEKYEAIFSEGRAEFRRRDFDLDSHAEIVVSPEDDIELRRVKITNITRSERIIDVTSYAEIVLAPGPSDLSHQAFSNLFVQTEIIPERQAIIASRRPRSEGERPPWMFHQMAVHGAEIRNITYETDRMRFIGRGNTLAAPDAMTRHSSLSGSAGSVLDPIVAIQFQIVLKPESSVTVDMVTGVHELKEGALSLIEKYQDKQFSNRVFELAWTHSQVALRQINANESDAQLYARLAGSIIYSSASLRAESGILKKNNRGQSGLWGYSISGDLPIVLLTIEDPENINLVRQMVQAHAYWRLKGLAVDLVIWNEDHAGYRQLLQDQIIGLISAGIETNIMDRPGGIFVRPGEQISTEDRVLFQTVARAIISDRSGKLTDQIFKRGYGEFSISAFKPTRTYKPLKPETVLPREDLVFYNGLGGFTYDGREYVITTSDNNNTPSPWVNVLANPNFGTVISENGQAYTWAQNAREYRLTPWNNDPVTDNGGEAIFIRDEETGHFWSPSPLTNRDTGIYISRHGFGYSVFEHNEDGIFTELWVYVATDAPVKFSVLKIKNNTGRPVRLSVTGYVEWVLGDLRHKSAMFLHTDANMGKNAIYAVNSFNREFADRVAFFQTDDVVSSLTCDRTEFIGRNGSLTTPAAMLRSRLSGKKGMALDPCGALQVNFEISADQEREVVFRLGLGHNSEDTANLIRRFRGSGAARKALEDVWSLWNHTLSTVQVETPDNALNFLTNGWLIYQTLTCRVWGRTGYYQSGGAYGFRDQLQDTMALVHTRPDLLREHLLLFASRQFIEGDVQHWWHPPSGRGVRTRCSDDFLWLPLAACRYVMTTGDTGVLDESVYFLEGRPVNPDDDSYYDMPIRSEDKASLYEHCKRAILYGMKNGIHGLPLIGTCDWNDGMNLVGHEGKGESVWLGFFMVDVLNQFYKIAQIGNDYEFAEICKNAARKLQQNLEKNAWDGAWYRRAYFDNGTPLGSAANEECQIDSISQSWAVLSGAGDPQRIKTAMQSVDERLVRYDKSLVQLLDPPFDKSDLNPGYIKGYVPGVRENGGQYTHAAIWTAMAFAKLHNTEKAWAVASLINPIHHGSSAEKIATYKIEPYVVAADVYAMPPHIGRGGWSWYTGSAGWMYRLFLESLLGLRLETDKLYIEPCIPAEWHTYKVHYRFRATMYHIEITRLSEGRSGLQITIDGVSGNGIFIPMVDDLIDHHVEVVIVEKEA